MPNLRARRARRPGPRRYTRRDRLVLGVLLGLPILLDLALIWGPTFASVGLSFTTWDGIGDIRWAGLKNYDHLFTGYPQFWPAVRHNLLWLAFLGLLAAPSTCCSPSSSTAASASAASTSRRSICRWCSRSPSSALSPS